MRIEWDEAKNRRNLREHGVSFETAQLVFDDPHHLSVQDREDGNETVRIISARKATARERKRYEQGD